MDFRLWHGDEACTAPDSTRCPVPYRGPGVLGSGREGTPRRYHGQAAGRWVSNESFFGEGGPDTSASAQYDPFTLALNGGPLAHGSELDWFPTYLRPLPGSWSAPGE
ncbi:hypothetical protein GCM10023166_23150 [Paeniglutamicibacter cryotolerans]